MLLQYALLHALMCTSVTRFHLVLQVIHAFNDGVINLLQSGETLIIFRHEATYVEQTMKLIFPPESKIHKVLIKHKNILWNWVHIISKRINLSKLLIMKMIVSRSEDHETEDH